VISEQGREAVVAILGPGDFFGEGSLNGHVLRVATSSALEECVVTRIEKASMIAALHNEPEFSAVFIAYLLARNGRVEEDLVDNCSTPANGASLGCSFSLQTSVRKEDRSRSWER
jgi:CRP/FNR family transcriptional regulator, cyclic AMP receptor protein